MEHNHSSVNSSCSSASGEPAVVQSGHLAEYDNERLAVLASQSIRSERNILRDALWHRLAPRVETSIRVRYRNLADAARLETADLLQEAFILLDDAIDHYRIERGRPFWPYYQTILIHHYIDLAKGAQRLQLQELRDDLPQDQSIEDVADIHTEHDLIEPLVPKELRDRDRKMIVFRLYHFHDWTIERLSRQFGKSVGTIHNWLHEMRKTISAGYHALYLA